MKRDLKRHKLLKILSEPRLKFESDILNDNEHLGISFEDLIKKMKCNILELNTIAAELYDNNEIKHHNAHKIYGLYCEQNGLTAFSNNKYKSRFWKDTLSKLFTISQIIVPIMALTVAIITVLYSQQSKIHTEEILLLKKELNRQQGLLDFQTNKMQTVYETIFLKDSLR